MLYSHLQFIQHKIKKYKEDFKGISETLGFTTHPGRAVNEEFYTNWNAHLQ